MANNEDIINVDRAFQNAWIVYINGIEVPAISATVSYGAWQIPEAQVSLVPDISLNRFGADDRVTVQVFYCDYWQTPSKPEFRLMFDGEIVAWSYVNTQRGRSVTFSCIDYTQIFSQLFFFFMSNIDDMATAATDGKIGVDINGVNTAGYAPLYPFSLFAQGLISGATSSPAPDAPPDTGPSTPATPADTSRPATYDPLITRPIDYVYNVITGLTDSRVPNRSVPGSSFFKPWAHRTNFNRRFIALPYLEQSDNPGIFPILRAVQASYAISAVAQIVSDIGSAGSIWQMFQSMLKTLMMEYVMLPTPPAYRSTIPELDIKGPATDPSKNRSMTVLGNYFVKPNMFFGLPPACNVFFPSQINALQYTENYITQPTRMYFNDEALLDYLSDNQSNASSGLSNFVRAATATAHPEEVNKLLREQQFSKGVAIPNHKNMLVYPEEFFKGPVVDRRTMPRWFFHLAQAQRQEIAAGRASPRELDPTNNEAIALYRKYAAYEFFKERYSRRNGALSLVFNPYPVPGFPCAIFDRRSTKMDLFGYITTVTQSLTSRNCSTQISFSYARTVQEVFSLLSKQFNAERDSINENLADIRNQIFKSDYTRLRGNQTLIGAMPMAPAEPLTEVRDFTQNTALAELFYRSLFYRFTPQAKTSSQFTQGELGTLLDRTSPDLARVAYENEESITAAAEAAKKKIASEGTPEVAKADDTDKKADAKLQREIGNRKASFFYADHLNLRDAKGNTQGIKIVGLDARTRELLLNAVIPGLRGGALDVAPSAIDKAILAKATDSDLALINAIDPTAPTENQINLLNNLEFKVATASTKHNLDGDFTLDPKPGSSDLFESYEAAMRFVARPICTLDEYIDFMGKGKGIREGRISANSADGLDNGRSFPAHYYIRIRRYRPGPPPLIMAADYGNSKVQGFPDGMVTRPIAGATTDGPDSDNVPGLPADFPETADNWDATILAYRLNALERLAPRT